MEARTTGEAGLYLLIAGHDIAGGPYRLDGTSLAWDIPSPEGVQTFSFTLSEPGGTGLGSGRSTLIAPDDLVAYARTIAARLAPPDPRYGAALYEALGADATNGRMVTEQALRFLPDGADAIPSALLRDASADLASLGRPALDQLLQWFTDLEALYARTGVSAPRPRDPSAYTLPEGWFQLEEAEREALSVVPFSLERIAAWNPFAVVEGEALVQHPQGAVIAVRADGAQVHTCRAFEGHEALASFIAHGFGLNEAQAARFGMVVRPGRSLGEILGELGEVNAVGQVEVPGGRIHHALLVTLTWGMYRQFVLFAMTDAEGVLLGARRLEWADGYEQLTLLLEHAGQGAAAVEALDRLIAVATPGLEALGRGELSSDGLRPRDEDYARVFAPEVVAGCRAFYDAWWDGDEPPRIAIHDDTTLDVVARPAGVMANDPLVARRFPGAYVRLAPWLEPDRVWLVWWYDGVRYDGLVWLGDHWSWFPKPWRAVGAALQ